MDSVDYKIIKEEDMKLGAECVGDLGVGTRVQMTKMTVYLYEVLKE